MARATATLIPMCEPTHEPIELYCKVCTLANGLFRAQEYLKYLENNKESKRLLVYYSKANLPHSHVIR